MGKKKKPMSDPTKKKREKEIEHQFILLSRRSRGRGGKKRKKGGGQRGSADLQKKGEGVGLSPRQCFFFRSPPGKEGGDRDKPNFKKQKGEGDNSSGFRAGLLHTKEGGRERDT